MAVSAVALAALGACAYGPLDEIYEGSLRVGKEIKAQRVEEYDRRRAKYDHWLRDGEIDPDEPEPVVPEWPSDREIDPIRLHYMQLRLVQFLNAKCPDRTAGCFARVSEKLGFQCTGAAPITCSQAYTAWVKGTDPLMPVGERHAWTVTIVPGTPAATVEAHAEIIDR